MNTIKRYTIIILTENHPGVLYRIAGVFVRRKINIEKLVVFETKKKGISRFRIQADMDETTVGRIIALVSKIVEVRKAYVI